MRRALTLLPIAALLAAAAPAHADTTVTAGPLRAATTSSPWHLDLQDMSGRTVLSESRGIGLAPTGTLGFRTTAGWWHATRVLTDRRDGAAYEATLATTDPLGGRIALRLEPAGDGTIALHATVQGDPGVQATGIAFDVRPGERYLGFGERSNAVDQRGNDVEDRVSEGPYQPSEEPVIAAFVPPAGYDPRPDATYFPVPWLLSTAGYGVLSDDDETSTFHLTTQDASAWSVEVAAPHLDLRFFAGPTPAAALRRMTAATGRQPPAAAPWYFGPWWQPSAGLAHDAAILRRAGALGSVVQTYTHYLPCGAQAGHQAAERAQTALAHGAGLAITTYFNPMICSNYEPEFDQAAAAGALTRNAAGQPYLYRYTGSTEFLVGQFDFSAPVAAAFYARLLGEAVANGYDGWMEDFGEYTPDDSVAADGTPGPAMHNRYPVLYHGAARAFATTAPRPLARFDRSGWRGAARVSQLVWGGDPTTSWGFDGLASAVRNGLTMGLSGVSLWGSDIGGYFSLSQPPTTPDLERRWIEMGFASGVMRTQANGFSLGSSGPRAQITDPGVLGTWRRYARLRTQVEPYLAAAERTYDRTGLPIMRDLALAFPADPTASGLDDEYLFGPSLLAAPVLQPAATARRLYLPRGRWVDLWRSATTPHDGSLRLAAARTLTGPSWRTIPAQGDQLPLLVRAGELIPMLPPDVQTLTRYGRGVVHLRDRLGRMTLLAWPAPGAASASPAPGERIRSTVRHGTWTLAFATRRTRTWTIQASLALLGRRGRRVRSVTLNGRRLPRRAWSEDRRTRVLHVRLRLRRGTLRARLAA